MRTADIAQTFQNKLYQHIEDLHKILEAQTIQSDTSSDVGNLFSSDEDIWSSIGNLFSSDENLFSSDEENEGGSLTFWSNLTYTFFWLRVCPLYNRIFLVHIQYIIAYCRVYCNSTIYEL